MDNFDLKKFLVENRLTRNSNLHEEGDEKIGEGRAYTTLAGEKITLNPGDRGQTHSWRRFVKLIDGKYYMKKEDDNGNPIFRTLPAIIYFENNVWTVEEGGEVPGYNTMTVTFRPNADAEGLD